MTKRDEVKSGISRICDQVISGKESSVETHSRRIWLQNFGLISASAGVLWACGGKDDDKATAGETTYTLEDKKSDANTMNVALGLEHEAIALYTAAAGLAVWDTDASALAPTFLEVAKTFLAHHQSHRSALTGQINDLKAETGVEPVAAPDAATVLAHYPGIADLKGASGLLAVLQVAAEREMNAANAYYGVIKSFKNKDLMQTLGGLSADEAAHYGVLNAAALAHDALAGLKSSKLTAANLVSAALPAFEYPNVIRQA